MADTVTHLAPRQLADAYVEALVAHNPGVAAGLGLHPDDDRQPDLSPEGFSQIADTSQGVVDVTISW